MAKAGVNISIVFLRVNPLAAEMGTSTASPESLVPATMITATNVFYMLLLPAVVLWYVYWKMSRKHLVELAEKIPGPPGLPLLGNALEFTGSPHCNIFF